ncbi:MAG: putative toxin-antitoxin system toxin component, PIN family [Treponema sp.]|nr:putative toxin-antitoxin system toxin component, PIN family [Treponema sp.]
MKVVLDTNVLISAILSNGPPAVIADLMANGKLIPFYNELIIEEYWDVLHRKKFNFQNIQIDRFLDTIVKAGIAVKADTSNLIKIQDEDDRKFYDVAMASFAYLITGNIRHYPKEPFIVTPAEFLKIYQGSVI